MRRQLAGPGERKDKSKPTPAIDPAWSKTNYVSASTNDVVKNKTGAEVKQDEQGN